MAKRTTIALVAAGLTAGMLGLGPAEARRSPSPGTAAEARSCAASSPG
nr:hypothetical protein [Nonomuraea pusilla]